MLTKEDKAWLISLGIILGRFIGSLALGGKQETLLNELRKFVTEMTKLQNE